MKRILIALMVVFTSCSLTMAQRNETIQKDSMAKSQSIAAQSEPASKAQAAGSVTVSTADNDPTSTYEVEFVDTPDDSTFVSDSQEEYQLNDASGAFGKLDTIINGGIVMAIFMVIITFSFPLFIIFIAFYFRYRNRKARYKLAEQALSAGHPIPEDLFRESLNLNTRNKGIKNICLGIGLFIFLWAITDSFGVGTIGLLVMFTGIGQWLTARNQKPSDEQK